ncbi:MAG: cobaltochelatase subunit CobN [Rhizobiaceae bacterium]|nr:cobaltochelatase subunit CobN [Rhizobiaceae bacterium]
MHILATTSASLEDLIEPVDLKQTPADVVALSFTDSDLAGIAAGWKGVALPSLRLAALRDLRHPMSVDLWIDSVARHAKVVLVRILGGYDWWRYGCDQLAALARRQGIKLALLPGECRDEDARLIECSTVSRDQLDHLLGFFREGGPQNMARLAEYLGAMARGETGHAVPVAVPKAGFYHAGAGLSETAPAFDARKPVVPIIFYRSMLLAADAAPIDALAEALERKGFATQPIFVNSLKDPAALAFVEKALAALKPAAIVTATAFAAGAEPGEQTLFDRAGVPVFQVITATTRREAWLENQRGLAPADLAMHVVLPELDGRILAGAISFKAEAEPDANAGYRGLVNLPEPDRIEQVASRIAQSMRLAQTERAQRKLIILIPDYPAAEGRTGYAVGLDVPSSVLAMLHDLKDAGYTIDSIPESLRALLDLLDRGGHALEAGDYATALAGLPPAAKAKLAETWGKPPSARMAFRAASFGNVTVALAPDRGRSEDRRADYHDPTLAPQHELVAFGFWMQRVLGVHVIVHVGAHGTLEWLPGKTVALSRDCFPEIVTGGLPVIYPFIVSNPGEAAQAKRRIGAVTLGHLPPPLAAAELDAKQQVLQRLVDEYAQADGLDRRRRDRLAKLIVETATETGLAGDAGVARTDAPDEALRRIDAWLCDLKDFAIKDGLHVYGRSPDCEGVRLESAQNERHALLQALDGRHVTAGPSGAPARGRSDVFPTGRNLYTADPRTMPTPTAFDLGRAAADEVLRDYLQSHGEWPRALVIDLWGSASLRTGGEEIAQGLALMGCRPQWDAATGRVTGIEVLPPAILGRPRVDVTFRISGLFRDMFPTQIALLDAAAQAVAAREETEEENPLAEKVRATGKTPARVYGSAPGTYGAGIEDRLARSDWAHRDELGQAYLAATSHAFGGAEGAAVEAPDAFAERLAEADLLVHSGDDPGRDILEGSADVAFIGGFAAALAALGRNADVVVLDTTDPNRPRPRSVAQAVGRVVRARATNPRFIEGQMRHGPRGAAEFAETVDRLVAFAETTEAISGDLIGAVHDAYLGNETVRAFLLRENPKAARAIARRFADARRRGLWRPLRNAIDDELAALIAEAAA